MKAPRHQRRAADSRRLRRRRIGRRWGAFPACFVLAALSFGACQSPTAPTPRPTPEVELDAAFSLELGLMNPPMGGDCVVTLTAAAKGGERDAFAVWGVLEAQYLNPDTRDWEDLRPQNLHEVFLGERITTGETQTATLDLECYRRDPGEEVTVRLLLHWVVNENGEEMYRSRTLIAECR